MMVRGGGNKGLRPDGYIHASADLAGSTVSMPEMVERYKAELDVSGGILFGADDPLLAPDLHGPSMQAHGLFYQELPGRGHMIPITAPED